ncbi:MAG: hypothetical protein LIP77_01820, partial [Planctomycetes bacterium]|nr:hypothetical protein [Planctomycetota bacterium]
MRSMRGMRTLMAALAAVSLATGSALAGDWPDGTDVNVLTGTNGTIVITNSDLKDNSSPFIFSSSSYLTSELPRGGAGVVVLPADDTVKTITASGLTVSNYSTTITVDGSYDTNAFGPLVVFGSQYAATASGTFGNLYVTDLTAVTFENVSLTNNETTLNVTQGDTLGSSSAFGGGARFANLPNFSYTGGVISDNTVTVTGTGNMDMVHANGGGFVIESDFGGNTVTLSSLQFSDNKAEVSGAAGNSSNARGGAIYIAGYNDELMTDGSVAGDNTGTTVTISHTDFTGNAAINSGTGTGAAAGGAVFANIAVKSVFSDVTFTGNSATSSNGNAIGGAVALVLWDNYSGGSGTLTALNDRTGTGITYYADFNGVEFTNNTAEGATASGGAIYTDKTILLSDIVFTGNQVVASGTAMKNAIHLQGADAIFYDVDTTSTD